MIVYQHHITRADLRRNPFVYYVFGDNATRTGYGGQAREMRGEPNAIGIATKWKPSKDNDAYFSDARANDQMTIMQHDFKRVHDLLRHKQTVVFPANGLGTGFADLERKSPLTWQFLQQTMCYLEGIR